MRVKTISVTYERKLNLGDYNSATIGASLWADLDTNEDPAKSIEALQNMAREAARAEAGRLKNRTPQQQEG